MNFQTWWNSFIKHFPQYSKHTYIASAAYQAGYSAAMDEVLAKLKEPT